MPALVRPADFPADAEGRVAFIAVNIVDGETLPGGSEPGGPARAASTASWAGGWGAVGVLGAVLVIVFGLGMLVSR